MYPIKVLLLTSVIPSDIYFTSYFLRVNFEPIPGAVEETTDFKEATKKLE